MKIYFYSSILVLLIVGCKNNTSRVEKATLMYNYYSNIERCQQLNSDFIKLYENLSDSSKSVIDPSLEILDIQMTYIDSVQDSLFTFTKNPKITLKTNMFDQLDECHDLGNYKIASDFLIGEDPASPLYTKFSASQIQEKLIEANKNIESELQKNGISIIRTQIDTEEYSQGQGAWVPWALAKFYHLPLGLAFGNLSEIQVQIQETKIQIIELVINN